MTKSEQMLMKNIRHLHFISNLSRIAWCKELGISRQIVGAWFEERALPQTSHLQKISKKLKISIDYLVRKDLSKMDIYDVRSNYMIIQKYLAL